MKTLQDHRCDGDRARRLAQENARLLADNDRKAAQIETQAGKIIRLNKRDTKRCKHIKALERELDKLTAGVR